MSNIEPCSNDYLMQVYLSDKSFLVSEYRAHPDAGSEVEDAKRLVAIGLKNDGKLDAREQAVIKSVAANESLRLATRTYLKHFLDGSGC